MKKFFEGKGFLTILLALIFIWSVTEINWGKPQVHPGGAGPLFEFFLSAFRPDLTASFIQTSVLAAWKTIAYSVAGITLAIAIGFPLGVIASGVLTRGKVKRRAAIVVTRFILAFFRSIHELVWALLFAVAIGLSPMTAVLALAIPYGGILGRIYSEIFVDVPEEPLRALRATGCSELKVFFYGRLPIALPDMLSYTFYRFECSIRAVVIMSFVGVGGLGYYIMLSMNDMIFGQVWTLLFFLIAIIVVVDVWGFSLRRRLVS